MAAVAIALRKTTRELSGASQHALSCGHTFDIHGETAFRAAITLTDRWLRRLREVERWYVPS